MGFSPELFPDAHKGDGKRTGADMGGDHAAELTPMDKGDAGDP